ncbi:MAG: YihY family inner membrane protein [Opitutales bacterium]|nr:YihY family inner membrane protein [Opitutales bacterium]
MENPKEKQEEPKISLAQKISRAAEFFTFGIWSSDLREMSKLKAALFAMMRIVSTTVSGIMKNKIPVQAASLSYTTLLALGPLVAVVIIFSGMVFKEKGDKFVYDKIVDAMVFVMPAVNEVVEPPRGEIFINGEKVNFSEEAHPPRKMTPEEEEAAEQKINPEIRALIAKISKSSASLGIMGTLAVVLTCLLLCVNMESAFNTVWGLYKGRSWIMRFTFYWMLLTFGVVLGISGMTFLTGSQLGEIFKNIPIISEYAGWGTKLVGMGALVVALALFYKCMPNTYVKAFPALVGALIVTCLLLANNKLSFLYLGKIVEQQNFYGYLAIIPIAMFSLYIFWLFILTGAQITYAIQNMDMLSSAESWKRTGGHVKRMLSLAVFAEISRAFYRGEKAPNLKALCTRLDIPKVVSSGCIIMLLEKNLVCEIEGENAEPAYKPATAPDLMTLAKFLQILDENPGDNIASADIAKRSPAANYAIEAFAGLAKEENMQKTIKELIL